MSVPPVYVSSSYTNLFHSVDPRSAIPNRLFDYLPPNPISSRGKSSLTMKKSIILYYS